MRKLAILLVIIGVLLTLSLNASSSRVRAQGGTMGTADDLKVTDDEIAAAKKALGDSVVGVIACTLETEYHSTVANGAVAQLKQYGLNAELFDSQKNVDREISGIESFTARGAKVIIV